VFEKYDGIRGFWNPLKKAMFSRKGKKFDLPQEVIDDMPSDLFLDGELWYASLITLFAVIHYFIPKVWEGQLSRINEDCTQDGS